MNERDRVLATKAATEWLTREVLPHIDGVGVLAEDLVNHIAFAMKFGVILGPDDILTDGEGLYE